VGYEWLAATLAALRGLEAYEVIQALAADRRWPRPATGPAGVPVLTIWARTEAGRRLIVVLRPANQFDWWIVGARDMTTAEAAAYDRWEAQQ
jgi:hypothetical protein